MLENKKHVWIDQQNNKQVIEYMSDNEIEQAMSLYVSNEEIGSSPYNLISELAEEFECRRLKTLAEKAKQKKGIR